MYFSSIVRPAEYGRVGEALWIEMFVRLMNDPRFDNIPIILETPGETRWKEEIAFLYRSVGGKG